MTEPSALLPSFLHRLADPRIRTVMLCGCGGGFDFVHSVALIPELRRLGKQVVIGSYSFGAPEKIQGEAPVVFDRGGAIAKRVSAASIADPRYGPEVHLCAFLDAREPETAPHSIYAYYARDFDVPSLEALYAQLVQEHSIDAIVLVDGGSDSLMAGDEEGLGDPIEDCVSITAVSALEGLDAKILISVGLGCDRFNHVSDAASLRAVAELTRAGGFLGAVALEPSSAAFRFYRDALDFIDERQPFRSVLSGAVVSSAEGHFGAEHVPDRLRARVGAGQAYLWPLMAILWAFDVDAVAARSLMSRWIRDQDTVLACYAAVDEGRRSLPGRRPVEELPRHEDMRGPYPGFFRDP